MGAYELIELDIYAHVAYYEMIEWIECLVVKFKLVWLDMITRWLLVSDLNGYMSCVGIQISWYQVWFTFEEA